MSYSDEETKSCDSTFSESDELLYDLIERLKSKKFPFRSENISRKIDPKYTSKLIKKNVEAVSSYPVPPDFETVSNTNDSDMKDSYVLMTLNKASRIFHAIASIIFHTSDPLMTTHTRLMYLKQVEKEYELAKASEDPDLIVKYVKLVNKIAKEYDEPWFDEEWLIASKAFFAPFHILHHCTRVPANPHVKRYAFSPCLASEPPIRLVLDNGDFLSKRKV